MNVEEWQRRCEQSRCKILPKQVTRHGEILLAERLTKDPKSGERVWETIWAISRDGADIGRIVRNQLVQEKHGIYRSTDTEADQKERIAEAVADAENFIKDSRKVGRYT